MPIMVTIHAPEGVRTVSVAQDSLLAQAIGLAEHHLDMPCGGRGVCGKCRVAASGGLAPPTKEEAAALGADLEKGLRLACVARLVGDAVVTLPRRQHFDSAVTSGVMRTTASHPLYRSYGVAVDVGTTTLAAKLCHDGAVVAEAASSNPQTAFGGDVISRIGLALSGQGDALAIAVRGGINALINRLCAQAGIGAGEIDAAVVTGNTAMLYLLTGRNPVTLSAAPFRADWLAGDFIDAAQLGLALAPGAQVYLPPCMGAFVGADITTAILACGITASADSALLVDIGTNGEMALWHNGILTCCSTAAGPAFEGAGIVCGMHGVAGAIDHVTVVGGEVCSTVIGGGKALGLCGSAVVDAVAAMLAVGALDETGRIVPEESTCPQRIVLQNNDLLFTLDGDVGLYGRDVRAVQLAKSAICAGLCTLLELCGLSMSNFNCSCNLHSLRIAGGFGSYLNLDSAAAIGLIPPQLRGCAVSVGNAALSGAVMLLGDRLLGEEAARTAKNAKVIDLGASSVFMDYYMDGMGF